MTDPFEFDEEEWVEICDAEGRRSSMRHLATVSVGGKKYFVLGALREEADGSTEHGLMLVREDQTIDGAQEYVVTEDESEIENVVGHFIAQSILKMLSEAAVSSLEEEECPCGMKHRAGEFCVCDNPDYLQ